MARFKVLAVVEDEDIRFKIRKALSGNESLALVGFAPKSQVTLRMSW